jgi:hypothetical protein
MKQVIGDTEELCARTSIYLFRILPLLCLVWGLLASRTVYGQSNLVLLVSQPGDYIGQGQTYVTTNTADFTAGYYLFGTQKDVRVGAFGFDLIFGGPGGAALGVGTYTNAANWPANGAQPGINVSGNGRACERICGNFQILEIHADGGGNLDRLWLTFTQYCECGSAPLSGEIRFNSQLAPPPPAARILHVPADYATIQAALDDASLLTVDTVLVAPGIYNEAIQFGGKRAQVLSEAGPWQTTITAPPGLAAVTLGGGESPDAILCGFTLTNSTIGVAVGGNSSGTIFSNLIINCGIGINCGSGSPNICTNSIIGCPNGAISLNFTGSPLVEGNLLQGNGGGIGMWEAGSPGIYNNVIRGNHGGGIGMVNYSAPNIFQNVIANNEGIGIYWLVPQGSRGPWIFNNTIAGNGGAGISGNGLNDGSVIFNNIVTGNPAMEGAGSDVEYNDFFPPSQATTNLIGTNGNISVDPQFIYPANSDFHLFGGSLCINAGTNSHVFTNTDLSGNPRIIGSIVDQGAYEFQAAHYVDANNVNPVAPYTNWATAAVQIQDAIDVASPGDPILVTNGIYQTGGRVVNGALTNRVAVTKSLGIESVNGAASTIIQGNPLMGDSAVRCLYLAAGAELIGFTLTNGATRVAGDAVQEQSGGGAWCESPDAMLAECAISGNSANSSGGGAYQGTVINSVFANNFSTINGGGTAYGVLSNCTFTANAAKLAGGAVFQSLLDNCVLTNNTVTNAPMYWTTSGGGAFGSTLKNCLLVTNNTFAGGGAEQCALSNCVLVANSALVGGGADGSQLTNCTVVGNSAQSAGGAYSSTLSGSFVGGNLGQYGGGAEYSILTGCILATNRTYDDEVYGLGGGADSSTLNDCLLYGNVSATSAGASASTLNNCTVVSNVTTQVGGAVDSSTLYNSIIYYNEAPGGTNCSNSTLTNCCSIPLADLSAGNITNTPLFVYPDTNNFRLQSNSPCINSGNNIYVTPGPDLDHQPRIVGGSVDMGAYEYQVPTSRLSYAWAQRYGLPIDGSADFADADGDGLNNWQEWIAGTNPTNAQSVLKVLSPVPTNNASGITVTWASEAGKNYFVQRAVNLKAKPAFSTIQTNIAGLAGTTSYQDVTATNGISYFYRVGVQ